MSFSILRSRISHQLTKTPAVRTTINNPLSTTIFPRRVFSTNPPKELPLSSAYDDPFDAPSTPPPPPPPLPPRSNPFATALKFGLTTAVTGVVGAVGYATYAYTLGEVDEKTKTFRASAKHSTEDDGSTIKKVQAAITTAPAKAIGFYLDLRKSVEEHVRGFTEPLSDALLPDLPPHLQSNIFTLVVDLNETLLYSDWKRERGWRTFKRPGVDAFLEHLAQFYEIVVYSDNLQMYVDPVIDRLDEKHFIAHRLSRAATLYKDGKHYRDLSKLNRDPRKVIYISGHALEHCLQAENCIEIKPWKSEDLDDTTLLDLIPFLEFVAQSGPPDIRKVIASYQGRDIAKEFVERSKEFQRRVQQKQGRAWRR